jgi:type I restriction-modification system DNA methylase subunit
MGRVRSTRSSNNNSANIGFEQKLWLDADKLRSNMDAAEYKHVVLGLIFLKYISDSFEEHHKKLVIGEGEYAGGNPEDPDEYCAENIFWVPLALNPRITANHSRACLASRSRALAARRRALRDRCLISSTRLTHAVYP